MSEAHRATEGFDACEVAAAHEVMALAFDSGELSVPRWNLQRSKAISKWMRNDPLRSPFVQVRTFSICYPIVPSRNLPPQVDGPRTCRRAAKRIRALLDVECAAERVGEEVDGRDNCEWGGFTRTVTLAAPARGRVSTRQAGDQYRSRHENADRSIEDEVYARVSRKPPCYPGVRGRLTCRSEAAVGTDAALTLPSLNSSRPRGTISRSRSSRSRSRHVRGMTGGSHIYRRR